MENFGILVAIVVIVLILFATLIAILSRYRKCPSDKILVVYGKVGTDEFGNPRSAKCIHGGAAFIVPVIQSYQYLDLTPISMNVDLRNALSTQNVPPNQVVVALSLFLTFYIMAPYWGEANEQGIQPYLNGEITQTEALDNTVKPLREFMFKQTRESDLALFVNLSDAERPDGPEDVSTFTLIPAFVISELKTAFQIGFMIYIPFIVIDMIVASTLMSMGMMMLPPVMISLPFKILLFVMVDGWHLLIKSLIVSFK